MLQALYGASSAQSASAQQLDVQPQQNPATPAAANGSAASEALAGALPAPFSAPATTAPPRVSSDGTLQGTGSLGSSGSDAQLSQRDAAAAAATVEAQEDDTPDSVASIAQGLESTRCAASGLSVGISEQDLGL